jgi:hypothetical protein
VSQIWRGFERPIISSIVVARNLNRVFGIGEFPQIGAPLIVVMRQGKAAVGFRNDDFANTNAISDFSLKNSRDSVLFYCCHVERSETSLIT